MGFTYASSRAHLTFADGPLAGLEAWVRVLSVGELRDFFGLVDFMKDTATLSGEIESSIEVAGAIAETIEEWNWTGVEPCVESLTRMGQRDLARFVSGWIRAQTEPEKPAPLVPEMPVESLPDGYWDSVTDGDSFPQQS